MTGAKVQEGLGEKREGEDTDEVEGLHQEDLNQRDKEDQGQEVEFEKELDHF